MTADNMVVRASEPLPPPIANRVKVLFPWGTIMSNLKGPVPKKVKSITFTFVSQFGANFVIKFLIVY